MSDAGASSGGTGGAPDGAQAAYHVDLRQFPHNACRFNLTRQELWSTIVEPWAREKWIEMGERKWSPHQAKLTILEGPHIPVEQLSMGRGWRVAQRQAHDVTEQLLATAREAANPQSRAPATQGGRTGAPRDEGPQADDRSGASGDDGLLADSLGLELLGAIGTGEAPLRRAWELACARHPERTAGQCLMLAERAVGSLLDAGLIAVMRTDPSGGPLGEVPAAEEVPTAELRAVLRAIDSWTGNSVALARR
jgi:hypothetical protein